jgi:YD repeat-containing protein
MANAKGQRPTATELTSHYALRVAYDANGNTEYIGKAAINSADSSAVWQLQKFTYDANGNITSILWPGDESFTYIWDDRASLAWA